MLTWALVEGSDASLMLALAVVLSILQLVVLAKRSGGLPVTALPVVIINFVLTLGLLLWPSVAATAAVGIDIPTTPDRLASALAIGLTFTTCFALGAMIVRSPPMQLRRSIRVEPGPLTSFGALVLAATIIGRGEALWRGERYLQFDGPAVLAIASGALTPAALLALAIAAQQGTRRLRFWTVVLVLAWAVVLFGMATRQLALIPGALLLGSLMSEGRRGGLVVRVIITGLATVALAQLPLTLRGRGVVGIANFAEILRADPELIAASFDTRRLLGNLLFSSPLTERVANTNIPDEYLWTSVSPLPGSWTDWPLISGALGLNQSTPYNGLGELAAHGVGALCAYAIVAGLALSAVARLATRLGERLEVPVFLAITALTLLFSLDMLQYNLRSGTRAVWYAIAIAGAATMVRLVATAGKDQLKRAAG